MGWLYRHRGLTPYLLLAPGLLYLGLFFAVPLGSLLVESLKSGNFDVGYSFQHGGGEHTGERHAGPGRRQDRRVDHHHSSA